MFATVNVSDMGMCVVWCVYVHCSVVLFICVCMSARAYMCMRVGASEGLGVCVENEMDTVSL